MNSYKFNDSDYEFNWSIDFANPFLGVDSEIAEWKNTGFFGIVNRISKTKKIISLSKAPARPFPTDSDLNAFDEKKNTLIRVAAFSPSSNQILIRDKKPLANIVAFHSRASFEPVLSSSGETTKTFINEDGFLNSLSGGVVQDNFFFSFHTYIIQSNLSIDLWRTKIKETLHPAGLLLFAETNLNASVKIPVNVTPTASTETFNTNFTFDNDSQ